jgi:phosphoribosylformylglycinamidine cyclo-ligase
MSKKADLSDAEMFATFNMGVGMAFVASEKYAQTALNMLNELGETAYAIGEIRAGERGVDII